MMSTALSLEEGPGSAWGFEEGLARVFGDTWLEVLVGAFSVGKGEGETGGLLLLAFFAFLLRSFSSSSDETASFSSHKLPSTLMVLDSEECIEAALKEGARFNELPRP